MRVLIAVDRSEYAEIVLEHGLDRAVQVAAGAIDIATVVASEGDVASARAWLEELVHDGLETFRLADRTYNLHVRVGDPVATIAELAKEVSPDVLVIGRFHSPSTYEDILRRVSSPTLVIGIDGPVLEPQCPACEAVRRATEGDELFCEAHHQDRLDDLSIRIPPMHDVGSRLW